MYYLIIITITRLTGDTQLKVYINMVNKFKILFNYLLKFIDDWLLIEILKNIQYNNTLIIKYIN